MESWNDLDAYTSRGRKRSEQHLPNLLSDITAIMDGQSQAYPQFRTNRLYTRLTATEVRRQLIAQRGKSRVAITAADHDFHPAATVTPVGIFLPASDEFFLYGVTSKVTSDCLVDRLIEWWESVRECFSQITTLVINLDNGPENHS